MIYIAAISFITLGISVHVALRLLYRNQANPAGDLVVTITSITGWLLIFYGISYLLFPFAVFAALPVFGMVVAKFREGERRALLWTLAITAEKGLPLAPSARAFGARRCDEIARRASLLADHLEFGMPLSSALRESGSPLPSDAALMAGLSDESSLVAAALRESAEYGHEQEDIWRPVIQQIYYLLAMTIMCCFVTAFITMRILPTFRMIFEDFATELPGMTQFSIKLANVILLVSPVVIPVISVYGIVVGLISLFYYVQGKIWVPWPFHWLFRGSVTPLFLRGLAVCVEQKLPLDQAMLKISEHFPRVRYRHKVEACAFRTLHGANWLDTLSEEKILTVPETAVLRSSIRANNLAWSLRELAELSNRRLIHRAKLMVNVVTPICLLILATPIAILVVGWFIPLVSLIQNLT